MIRTIVERLVNKSTRENPRIEDMELTGEILIGAPRQKVWAGLNDPAVLTRCIPGCEALEATSPTERTARVAVKIGPVRARFVGHVRMEDIRPDEGCLLRFEGSGGAAGMAKGHSQVELSDEAGGTRLRYTAHAAIGGKLGQVGGRMIDAASKQMADQFFAAFTQQMVGAPAAPDADLPDADLPVAAGPASDTGTPPAPVPTTTISAAPAPSGTLSGEGVRVLWFSLGVLSTAFGMWVASILRT
jgi:uncharacterized protein